MAATVLTGIQIKDSTVGLADLSATGTPSSSTFLRGDNTWNAPSVGNLTGLGTGVATFLGTPSSANLAAAITNETGTGSLVFATSPQFTTSLGIGVAPTSQFHTYNNSVDGASWKMENANATVSLGGADYGIMGQFGTTGYGVANWPNAFVIEGQADGGLVLGSYAGNIIFQTSNRTERARLTSGGLFGIGMTPTKTLDVTGTFRVSDIATFGAPATLKGYTVATLPAGVQGHTAFCTDLLAPGFLVAAVGGGAVVGPVFYNGAAWVAF